MTEPPTVPPTVTVSASAEREVPPDAFLLNATVIGEAPTSAEATERLIARYAELEAAVTGLPPTVSVSHGRMSSWQSGPKDAELRGGQPGWHTERAMSLDGADVDTVAEVAAALARVEGVAINGPHWRVERDNPAYADLQTDTVREATDRATRYAAAVGGTLGQLVQLRDPGTGGQAAGAVQFASRSARHGGPDFGAIDLSPQPITLSATVEATWYVELP